jgi:hypothetical protein
MLDRNWSGGVENGARVYSSGAFQIAFLLVIVWLLLTCLLVGFTKETYCKQAA